MQAKKRLFAPYFSAIKRQVRQFWHPSGAYRSLDPDGRKFGLKDRYTLLRVKIAPDGALRGLTVEMPSGIELLDDLAIAAFQKAAPFPVAPGPLVKDGLVDFRFGFYFEVSRQGARNRAPTRPPLTIVEHASDEPGSTHSGWHDYGPLASTQAAQPRSRRMLPPALGAAQRVTQGLSLLSEQLVKQRMSPILEVCVDENGSVRGLLESRRRCVSDRRCGSRRRRR